MNKFVYIAALALCGSTFAQEPQPSQTRPAQPQPGINQPPPRSQPAQPTPADNTAPKTTTERAIEGVANILGDWRFEELPPAVQKTVREQAGAQKIADIDRETRTGRIVWEVEFEKAGKNTEIHVADDGTLLPEGEGLAGTTSRTTQPGERPTATGTPAGTQTGRSGVALAMGTQWEDLPQAVQQKAMQFGGKEKVTDIDREDLRGKVAYEVEFRREGRNLEIYFGEDGTILASNDPSVAPAQGSAPGSSVGTDTTRTPSSSPSTSPSTQPARPQTTTPGQPTPPPQPNNPNPNQPQP